MNWTENFPSGKILKNPFSSIRSHRNFKRFANLDSWENSLSVKTKKSIFGKFLKNREFWKNLENSSEASKSCAGFAKILLESIFLRFSLSRVDWSTHGGFFLRTLCMQPSYLWIMTHSLCMSPLRLGDDGAFMASWVILHRRIFIAFMMYWANWCNGVHLMHEWMLFWAFLN